MARLTQEEFENKCRDVHGDKFTYSEDKYVDMFTDYKVVCKVHGVFEVRPVDHIHHKKGCLICSANERREVNLNNHKDYIEEKFKGKYKIVSSSNFRTLKDELLFNCTEHGDYKSKLSSMKNSPIGNCNGCKREINAKEFLVKAKEKHGGLYRYKEEDYVCSRTCTDIYCVKHKHTFPQRPSAHLQGQGCPICGDEDRVETSTKSNDDFIKESRIVHGDKYDYSKTQYHKAHTKVIIGCNVEGHPYFEIAPNNHKYGGGCPICSKEDFIYNTERFIAESKRLYNGRLDYSATVFVDRFTEVTLKCKDHDHVYKIKPVQHLGQVGGSVGCTHCTTPNVGRWNIQSIRKLPRVESKTGNLYLGKVSGLRGVKLGVTENILNRQYCYNTDLAKYHDHSFNYITCREGNYLDVFIMEYILKKVFSKYKVKHDLIFGGKNEVFDLPDKELKFIYNLLEGNYDLFMSHLHLQFESTRDDYTSIMKTINKLIEESGV